MEQIGHYYTVYFTSLAVGFDEDIAFKQAVYAQMPDQIDRLDAAHMHYGSCEEIWWKNKIKVDGVYTNDEWRALIEYVLHALPYTSSVDISSQTQHDVTKKLLATERPDSVAFGLLLHRLGDAYAHSIWGNEAEMYTVAAKNNRMECSKLDNWGHAKDGHGPDYPFYRPQVFYNYLDALYQILLTKVAAQENSLFRRKNSTRMGFNTLKVIFKGIIEDPIIRIYQHTASTLFPPAVVLRKYFETPNIPVTTYIIRRMRQECEKSLGIKMNERYEPEKDVAKPLREFMKDKEIRGIRGETIDEATIRQLVERLNNHLAANSPQVVPDYTNRPLFDINKDINSIVQSWPR